MRAGFGRLASTAHSVRHFSELVRFLTVFFVYSMGLTSVIAFAGIFAERTLHFTSTELIYLFIALQLSSAVGAFVFGFLQDQIGASRTIQITLVLWILVCAGVYFCQTKGLFWGVALGAGLGIGSLQSASRGLVGLFSPPEKSGEFFGFWGLAGKGAYMLGPFLFGLISTGSGSQRVAILSTAVFFIAGPDRDGLRGRAAGARRGGVMEALTSLPRRPHPNPSPKGEGLEFVDLAGLSLSFRRGSRRVRSMRQGGRA